MGATVGRVNTLSDKLYIGFREAGRGKGILQGWFDCNNLPDIPFTVGGCKHMYPRRCISERHPDDATKCKFQGWGAEDVNHWVIGNSIFQIAAISAFSLLLNDRRRLNLSM